MPKSEISYIEVPLKVEKKAGTKKTVKCASNDCKVSWVEFCKEYQKNKECSYAEAMKEAGPYYKKYKEEMKGGNILKSIGSWLWENAVKPIGKSYMKSIFKG